MKEKQAAPRPRKLFLKDAPEPTFPAQFQKHPRGAARFFAAHQLFRGGQRHGQNEPAGRHPLPVDVQKRFRPLGLSVRAPRRRRVRRQRHLQHSDRPQRDYRLHLPTRQREKTEPRRQRVRKTLGPHRTAAHRHDRPVGHGAGQRIGRGGGGATSTASSRNSTATTSRH